MGNIQIKINFSTSFDFQNDLWLFDAFLFFVLISLFRLVKNPKSNIFDVLNYLLNDSVDIVSTSYGFWKRSLKLNDLLL